MSDPRFTAKTPCPTCDWRQVVAAYYGLTAAQARRLNRTPATRAEAASGFAVTGAPVAPSPADGRPSST